MVALSLLSTPGPSQAAVVGNPDPTGGERRSKGSPDAPLVITEWLDYQCPSCKLYETSRAPEIERRYVETGKVRIEYRNMAFLGPESIAAAESAECAADQGYYLAYHSLLFQRQGRENGGSFSADRLKGLAGELGLDREDFSSCLDSGKYRPSVIAETREGTSLGVQATPSFQINGRMLRGVPNVEQMSAIIEEELAKNR